MDEILKAVEAARQKFPTWPTNPFIALAIVAEELGELTQALVDLQMSPEKYQPGSIREEALHMAAMSIEFVRHLDLYDYDIGLSAVPKKTINGVFIPTGKIPTNDRDKEIEQ